MTFHASCLQWKYFSLSSAEIFTHGMLRIKTNRLTVMEGFIGHLTDRFIRSFDWQSNIGMVVVVIGLFRLTFILETCYRKKTTTKKTTTKKTTLTFSTLANSADDKLQSNPIFQEK